MTDSDSFHFLFVKQLWFLTDFPNQQLTLNYFSYKYLILSTCFFTGGGRPLWIGGSDVDSEGNWKWMTSQILFNYTDWYPGEPNNYGGNEDCLYVLVI